MQLEERASSATLPLSNSNLVFNLNISVLVVILVFSLFNVPRALLYFANHRSEIFQGYLLRTTKQVWIYPSSSSMTLQSTENKKGQLEYPPTLESGAVPKQPWHLPMHFSLRHPAASFMQYRVFENYAVVQVFLAAGYTAAMFYTAFYASDPFSDPKRAGWVIVSQIPLVYAFATKNNVVGLLVGVGYEKLNYLHRHVGRLIIIGANVHAIGYIYKWTLAGDISQRITLPFVRWGIIALICFDLLGFFSLQCVRTKSYNLFFGTHAVALVAVLFAACLHQQACVPYVITGSIIYGLDHAIRVIKTHFTTATLQTIPGLGLVQVNIPSLNTGWRPGQHVRLRVLSIAVGLWGMTEVHPFTIASATNTREGLVLMCKKTGNWTRKLYEMAQTSASGELGRRSTKVMVEGPYGGIGDITIPNYSGAMFVAGGSGVTFVLSTVQDLVLAGTRSRVQVIEVIWSIPDPTVLENFIPLFYALASESTHARFHISVFYTRAAPRLLKELLLPPTITLTPGRPKIETLLDQFVISMTSLKGGAHGAFVGVCGPTALAKDVAHAVRTFDAKSKKAIGGIQLHEEIFGW